ncbi:MAG: hemerythrin domain-containing protein [Deltaproteobacteria bacterium]|nr:hemerythrin domain-containing protein [Deltaproteobacteria bacterium]
MAKRHPALIPLSHDHHHGLALALRCRKHALGQLNPGDPAAMEACAAEAARFFGENLQTHFEAEETVLFPLMTSLEDSRELVARLESDHRKFRDMVARSSDAKEMRKFLFDFGDLLEQHIRSEERQLFAAFELYIPEADAERAGVEIDRVLRRNQPSGSDAKPDTP